MYNVPLPLFHARMGKRGFISGNIMGLAVISWNPSLCVSNIDTLKQMALSKISHIELESCLHLQLIVFSLMHTFSNKDF